MPPTLLDINKKLTFFLKVVAWEFVLLLAPFGLVDGGTPAVFWGLLLSPLVMLPVYASLAEIASMSPTAGGQSTSQWSK